MESKRAGNKTFVTEYNVILLVDKNPTCPKKSEVFYNEEITLNRLRKFLYYCNFTALVLVKSKCRIRISKVKNCLVLRS